MVNPLIVNNRDIHKTEFTNSKLKNNCIIINLNEWEEKYYSWSSLSIDDYEKWIKSNLKFPNKLTAISFYPGIYGLKIKTRSYVGSIRLGNIIFQIKPKIYDIKFSSLFNYAFNFENFDQTHYSNYNFNEDGFIELLLIQLKNEAEKILSLGLYKNYEEINDNIESPRGKINFQAYIKGNFYIKETVPCIFHKRTQNNLLNQILMKGMHLGAFKTPNLRLRYSLLEIVKYLKESVNEIGLSSDIVKQAFNKLNRQNEYYRSALNLISFISLPPDYIEEKGELTSKFPAFFFDMNYFFQRLLQRLFEDALGKNCVKSESNIKNIYSYSTKSNPRGSSDPNLRPDYIISNISGNQVILDAKYRDLYEKSLPSKWLYQLSMYSLSGKELQDNKAIILYPTNNKNAKDAIIQLRIPLGRNKYIKAYIIIRPIIWDILYQMVENRTQKRNKLVQFSQNLVFGENIEEYYKTADI